MHDDYRARSPERGVDRDSEAIQTGDLEGRQDDYYQSRQGRRDSSRSPARHDFHDETRERHGRYPRGTYRERDHDGRHRNANETQSGRDGSSRGPRHRNDWEYDKHGGMYDDDYHRGRREGNRRDDSYANRRERRDHRSRSPAGSYRSPTRDAGKPTNTVILEGLPFNISTSELRDSLLNHSVAAEFPSIDVRISSSNGNRRAFVQFGEIEHAIAFMKEHFPQLLVHLPHTTDEAPDGRFSTFIHYARPREDVDTRGPNGANWTCPLCEFSNYSTRNRCKICGGVPSAPPALPSLNGATDTGDGPTQILLVQPLPPFVTENILATEMKRLELEKSDRPKETVKTASGLKSTAPTGDASDYGARPGSVHRVFLMRDTKTNESIRYGFVEFWTLEDAMAAMTKFRLSRNFTVAASPVTVSHIHLGVFIPETRELAPEIERLSFTPLFNPSIRVKYRDARAYPNQSIVTVEPPQNANAGAKPQGSEQTGDGTKSKKRKAEGNSGASTTKKPVPMAGHIAMWQRKHDELHGSNSKNEVAPNPSMSAANRVPFNGSYQKSESKIKISLLGVTMLGAPPAPPGTEGVAEKQNDSMRSEDKDTPDASDAGAAVSYVDRERLMCLICMRKYKSVDEVNIHEKSRNHKTAMENDELVKAALPRLAIRDKRMQKQAEENGEAPQYRDRAKERREAYNQPNKPSVLGDKAKPEASKPQAKDESKAVAAPTATAKPTVQSKGAGMLAKMGWTSGSGLGANGDGRTDTIATNAYQEGVGLGAEGGNLGDAADIAEKKTRNSYAEYLNTVQDKARERYNKMA